MLSSNPFALKEWSVVCAALAAGQQTILLRKGGIAEGPDGFTVKHPEFWLFPTRFHQSPDELKSDAASLIDSLTPSPEGKVRLSLYATVENIRYVEDVESLADIASGHILSEQTVHDRFHYRQPGLFVLTVRTYQLSNPIEVTDLHEYAGCHSWVELDESLSTNDLQYVLSDPEFHNAIEP